MKNAKKILAFILTVVMLFSVLPLTASAAQKTDNATYLLFTSDTHNVPYGNLYANSCADRLGSWITSVSDSLGGVTFDTMGICGDLGSAIDGTTGYWKAVRNVMDIAEGNSAVNRAVYTYGNHDAGVPGSGKDPVDDYNYCTSKMTQCSGAHYDGYSIFCIGVRADSYQRFADADINAMASFLAECPSDEPVFIMSHYPLHSIANRPIYNGEAVMNVLNGYPNAIFLWGHNHTEVDSNYGTIFTRRLANIPIKFTYLAAGAMVDGDYGEPQSADIIQKGLAVKINDDKTVTFIYFDINGNSLGNTTVSIVPEEKPEGRHAIFTIFVNNAMKIPIIETIAQKIADTFIGGGSISDLFQAIKDIIMQRISDAFAY